jgi:hypothetical protein
MSSQQSWLPGADYKNSIWHFHDAVLSSFVTSYLGVACRKEGQLPSPSQEEFQ